MEWNSKFDKIFEDYEQFKKNNPHLKLVPYKLGGEI